jgi:tetratricopeptide (TPR) repeat protein
MKAPTGLIHALLSISLATSGCTSLLGQTGGFDEAHRAFYQGDFTVARKLNEEFLKQNPSHVKARILRARILSSQADYQGAFAELHQLSRQAPEDIDVLYYLGVLSAALSNDEYRKIFQSSPDSARAYYLTGLAYEAQGKTEEAISAYEQALRANPNLVDALISQADLLRIRSRFDEAAPRYEKVLEREPDNYDALYGLGSCFHFRGDYEKGKEYFRQALEQDPSSATAHLALGITLLRTDQVNEAAAHLERAAELEPEMDQAYLMLGQAYRRQGLMDKAREVLRKAETLKKRP